MPVVELRGCRPQPLGSYLKALAVLRLVSKQKDSEALGWWENDYFKIESALAEDQIVTFFLDQYAPTPIIAPWNKNGGFYAADNKAALEEILGTEGERFNEYRLSITRARSIQEVILGELSSNKAEEERKKRLIRACRRVLPDSAVDWLDAAVVVTTVGDRHFSPILGTGGNEGHLNYTRSFMEKVVKLVIKPDRRLPVEGLLRNALYAAPVVGFDKAAAGQYDPGRAGGFNQGQAVETKDIPINPWNSVLTLEGAVSWASGLHRRQGTTTKAYLASPFTVNASAVGFNSVAEKDQTQARAEIWAPIWDHPATFGEIEVLMREGRAQLKRGAAKNGLEFAQAASSLGVERGISGFARYSLLKRRGDSYVALPAGRFAVDERKHADLLEQVAPLMDRVDGFLRSFRDSPPLALKVARRRYDDAVYEFLLKGGDERFRRVTVSLGCIVRELLLRPKDSSLRLGATLRPAWLGACGDLPTVRLAAALAHIRGIRSYLTRDDNDFSWHGTSLTDRMANVLQRMLLNLRREEGHRFSSGSSRPAKVDDVTRFILRNINDEELEDLMFAFILVRSEPVERVTSSNFDEEAASADYCVLRLLFDFSVKSPTGERMKGEARVLPLLRAGRIGEACKLAERRLATSGFSINRAGYTDLGDGPRLAAALLIPAWGTLRQARLVGVLDELGKEEKNAVR